MSHKSASWKYVACYTHTTLSTLNAMSLDPSSNKWQLNCSSAAAGQHMGRQLGGLELYRQSAAAGYPWLCDVCASLDLLGPLHSLGSPLAGRVGGLRRFPVQHPLISAEQCLLFWCFASSSLSSFLSSNAFTSGSLITLHKQLSILVVQAKKQGHTFYSLSFYKCPKFEKLNLKVTA